MYSESSGSRKTVGDVDVLYHNGIYHLFHLVLPNHDYIAHAVSNNCLQWRRVENALSIGHPGSWDDSMLWTVHVSANPHKPGSWRMFYTGLSRRDHGEKQRIGMAESDDLYCWKKAPVNWIDRSSELPYDLPGRPKQPPFEYDPNSCFPLNPDGEHYESEVNEGRHWVSWRDPFYYHEDGRGWLLTAGRTNTGAVVRRGCVAMMEETSPNHFEQQPPLYHPGLYDDVEVPNLFRIAGTYYLVGSMREDAKVRYWYTDKIGDPWRTGADNVLLATGNYAGRVSEDEHGFLLWNFYTPSVNDRVSNNLMPPPKRLFRTEKGQLRLKSFEGFDSLVQGTEDSLEMSPLKDDQSPGTYESKSDGTIEVGSDCGFQIFALEPQFDCFRLRAKLQMLKEGKLGIAFRLNRETEDGYYLSLDLVKGVAQMRSWGSGPEGSGEDMMQFRSLQAGFWAQEKLGCAEITLIAYGSYLELSIGSRVILSLADQTFSEGAIGFGVQSARLRIEDLQIEHFDTPVQSDQHLANG